VAKVRVSALAKELGTDSKTLIAHLQSIGEYVKTASSTIEAPVVRKATETFPEELKKKAPAKKTAAKKAPVRKAATKAPAKKTAAKKAPAKKAATKAPARKAASKAPARKAPAKKTTARRGRK
jgi:translation initiation factor IF-2